MLVVASVARDLGVSRKTVEGYFDLLDDLLLGVRLPVFARRAKRQLTEGIRVLPRAKALPALPALLAGR